MQKIGYANGLVWTPSGSHLFQIKAYSKKGTGRLLIEGDIGQDFLASLQVAIDLAAKLTKQDLAKTNLTVTIPGMIDGTSSGLALFIAVYSAFIKKPVDQKTAFIGAITPSGIVNEVDEILDKLTAASRAKMKGIIIPFENFSDLVTKAFPNMYIGGALTTMDALVYAFC